MSRWFLIAALAVAYFAYSNWPAIGPTPTPVPAGGKIESVLRYANSMTPQDKQALGQAYEILAKAVDGDPRQEPVFLRVSSVRQAHRAALEVVWVGVLGNTPAKYPGLGPALEALLNSAVGSDDVPLSEPLRTSTVNLFRDISFSFQ